MPCPGRLFGQVFLRGGRIDGEQIVPASWIAQSTSIVSGGEWYEGIVVNQDNGYDWYTAGQQTDGIMMIIRDQVLPAVLDN